MRERGQERERQESERQDRGEKREREARREVRRESGKRERAAGDEIASVLFVTATLPFRSLRYLFVREYKIIDSPVPNDNLICWQKQETKEK